MAAVEASWTGRVEGGDTHTQTDRHTAAGEWQLRLHGKLQPTQAGCIQYVCVCVWAHGEKLEERQHSGVLKQLRALIRLQAEISHDDKLSNVIGGECQQDCSGWYMVWWYWKSDGILNTSSKLGGTVKHPEKPGFCVPHFRQHYVDFWQW